MSREVVIDCAEWGKLEYWKTGDKDKPLKPCCILGHVKYRLHMSCDLEIYRLGIPVQKVIELNDLGPHTETKIKNLQKMFAKGGIKLRFKNRKALRSA